MDSIKNALLVNRITHQVMSRAKRQWRAVLVLVAAGLMLMFNVRAQSVSPPGATKTVVMLDDCDAATFNSRFGPGTCAGNGKTTFDDFIAQLSKHQTAPLWKFTPHEFTVPSDVPRGKSLKLVNAGGETHSFTQVNEFGGGFVVPLNNLSGNPVPRPECTTGDVVVPGLLLQPQPDGPGNIFVEAGEEEDGPAAGGAILPAGKTIKFQCCIHPWMRIELRTEARLP